MSGTVFKDGNAEFFKIFKRTVKPHYRPVRLSILFYLKSTSKLVTTLNEWKFVRITAPDSYWIVLTVDQHNFWELVQ